MPSNPKLITYRNEKYLNFIRSKGCLICGGKAQAHHVRRQYWGSGVSQTSHDYCTIPLCYECHSPEAEKELNVERIIIDNLMEYLEKVRKERKGKDAAEIRKAIENALSDSESWGPGEAIEND